MSYEKTTWQNGDTITAEKLNKIENGIAANSFSVIPTTINNENKMVLTKTWQELYDEFNGDNIMIIYGENHFDNGVIVDNKFITYISAVGYQDATLADGDKFWQIICGETHQFKASGPNDYPVQVY